MRALEILTVGRVGVDLYPLQAGVRLEDVTAFGKWRGGSVTNVAVAAASYRRRAAVITRTGANPFGMFVHAEMRGDGVDDRYVTSVAQLPTPVTFCEIFPPDDFPLYCWPIAPELEIHSEDLDLDAIRSAGVFWVTVTGLSDEPSRTATLTALRARAGRGITVLDVDCRAQFWPTREHARHWARQALPYVSLAVGNLDECDTALGKREPLAAARALHECPRRRRPRRRPVPRAPRRPGSRTRHALREGRRGHRRGAARLLGRNADGRRGAPGWEPRDGTHA